MAAVTLYVNTGSTSGGNGTTNATSGANRAYVSIAAALTGINGGAAATGDDITILCCAEDVGSGNAADTSAVNINNTNLSVVTPNSMTIAANTGHVAGKYNGNVLISSAHYRLSVASGSAIAIAKDVGNVTIDGLQIECSGGSFRGGIVLSIQAARTYNFINNRVRLSSATRLGIGMPGTAVGTDGQTLNIYNNVISGADVAAIELWNNSFRSPTWNIYHNTLYGDGSANLLAFDLLGSATLNIKNNCGWNSGANTEIAITHSQTPTLTYDKNAFQDGNGTTNEITLTSTAATWTSAGTTAAADFSVKDASSQIYNAGVTGLSITTDICGVTRDASPDIGAFELVTGSDTTVNITKATLSISGKTAFANASVPTTKATLAISGKTFLQNIAVPIAKKVLTWTGGTVTTGTDTNVAVTKASLAISGKALNSNVSVPVSKATVTFSGKIALGNVSVPITLAALTINEKTFSVNAGNSVSIDKVTLSWIGKTFLGNVRVPVAKATVTITGKTLNSNVSVSINKVSLTWAGKVVTVLASFVIPINKFTLNFSGKTVSGSNGVLEWCHGLVRPLVRDIARALTRRTSC